MVNDDGILMVNDDGILMVNDDGILMVKYYYVTQYIMRKPNLSVQNLNTFHTNFENLYKRRSLIL